MVFRGILQLLGISIKTIFKSEICDETLGCRILFVCLFVCDPRLWVVNPFRLLMLLCGISRYFSVDHNFRTGSFLRWGLGVGGYL